MSDVTHILSRIEAGDPSAAAQLLPLVYDELRKLAAARLAQEKPGQTLVATALVHEAYLRLVAGARRGESERPDVSSTEKRRGVNPTCEHGGVSEHGGASEHGGTSPTEERRDVSPTCGDQSPRFNSRGHFFAAAAEAMRRIVVDSARRKRQTKRGGDRQQVPLEEADVAIEGPSDDLLALDESLRRLETDDALAAQVVKLRYFAGLKMPEVAEALGISLRTAQRNWTFARTWLHCDLESDA